MAVARVEIARKGLVGIVRHDVDRAGERGATIQGALRPLGDFDAPGVNPADQCHQRRRDEDTVLEDADGRVRRVPCLRTVAEASNAHGRDRAERLEGHARNHRLEIGKRGQPRDLIAGNGRTRWPEYPAAARRRGGPSRGSRRSGRRRLPPGNRRWQPGLACPGCWGRRDRPLERPPARRRPSRWRLRRIRSPSDLIASAGSAKRNPHLSPPYASMPPKIPALFTLRGPAPAILIVLPRCCRSRGRMSCSPGH